jgi:hypothetical protein
MENGEMAQASYDVVTLKPKWSVRDLFSERDQAENRSRILEQLQKEYLNKGWMLADNIIWGRNFGFAVVKLGRPSPN